VFAKPARAMLPGSPQAQACRTSRAVAITARVGAYPHPPRTRRCRVVGVRTAGYAGYDPCLRANLLTVLLLLLI
jgi:hypothetical protein